MFKALILTLLLLLLSSHLVVAQAAANFDGVDDKATVYHHSDFNLSTHDFTIEAIVRDVALEKPMLTIISKRNLATNGFALMINTHDGMKVIAEIGKNKYEVNTSVFEDKGCHSVGLRRLENNITLFIDDKAYPLGKNTSDINTTENLIIGDDGSSTHQPFNGYIEEIRFWKNARIDEEIFDWNHKCIPSSSSDLLALWNIEENAGQFFHDVASIKHHAYLGNGFRSDNQDPLWSSNECLESCCGTKADFNVSNSNPLAAQWVNFTNTSTNAISYEWSIDNQVITSNQDLQYSFAIGVYIVGLKATNKSGCSAYYSTVIEVTDNNFSYCGEEKFTSPQIQALEDWENSELIPSPFPTIKMYDRFGNRYLPNDVTIPSQLRSTGSTNSSCGCGIFELYFEDVFYNRDYGFDDPTLGADRRAVACRVFEDLSVLVNPSGTLTNNLVKIQVKKSEGKAPLERAPIDELDSGILAVAGPYLVTTYNVGTIDGLVYKTITSGTNALANTPGWNTNSFHGSMRVDFELPNFFLNNNNWTSIAPNNQTDLYSTLLHESLHLLGFYSLIDATNNLSIINGTQVYNRYDTYLEDAAGNPYIDPSTGILNPTSNFIGSTSCTADVKFNGNVNTNQQVYLPSPWNFSILSHFNCNASNYLACASNNGYIMNACIPAGEMQRAPSQAEYSTLCDIGYQLSGVYGNSSVGTPNNNIPYQTYVSCSFPCAVAGINDDLTTTISVAPGGTVTINANDFLANDNNIGGSYNLTTLLSSFGTFTNVTTSSFDFTADPNFWGTAIIQYHPTCANGNNGSNALIFIQVTAPPFPTCDLPANSCNLLCFGDFENIVGAQNGTTVGIWDDFLSTYNDSGTPLFGSVTPFPITTELIRFNTNTNAPIGGINLNPKIYQCIGATPSAPGPLQAPLPVNYPNKTSYIGMNTTASAYPIYDQIYLPLATPLDVSTAGTDNYRLTFWAFTSCVDVHLRMILSDAPPCINGVNNFYDPVHAPYSPTPICPSFYYVFAQSPNCSAYTAALNKGIILNNPSNNPPGVYTWKQYSLDFHVNTPNVQHAVFHPVLGTSPVPQGGSTTCASSYILLDEMVIEKIDPQPQLTINSSIIGTPCPGNKVIIEYDICSDAPVSNLNLNAPLPLGSGLLYTNTLDFNNGQITGLDLGTGGNPLCTLVQLEVEIPVGASTPSTQRIVLDATGGTACISASSNLTMDINITGNTTLALAVVPSVSGNVSIGNNFTADIVVSNTGNNAAQNVVVELPMGPYSLGLNYVLTTTTIPSIPAGGQYTISAIPISVSGPCGDAQVCAEIISADNTCNLPSACSPLLTVIGASTTSFPIEAENAAHTDATIFTATAISNNHEIYSVGIFSNDIDFTEGTNTNTLVKSHTCSSLFSPFLVKYSSCGFEWAVEIPACNLLDLRTVPDVEVGHNGDIYVAFSFLGSFTINGTTYTSQGDADIAIIKYDATGTPVWVKTEGGVGEDWVTDIETYYNGTNEEVFIVGTLFGSAPNSILFNTTPITTVNYNNNGPFCSACLGFGGGLSGGTTYLSAYTDYGNLSSNTWVKTLNNVATFSGKLSIDMLGNSYIIGYTNSSFSFNSSIIGNITTNLNEGPPSSSNADIDLFVLKYDNLGNEIWAEIYGSDKIDIGYLEASDFEFDIECEGSTHLGILLPSGAINSNGPQPYMQNFGTHLLRINTFDGSLNWVRPIALPSTTSSSIGNIPHACQLKINNSNYLISGSFYLGNPNSANPQYSPNIDFHGTTINYTSMSAYPVYDKYQGTFLLNFNNTGTMQWVLPNTSLTVSTPSTSTEFALRHLDIETDNFGNIYSPFYLQGMTTINSNNLIGGIGGNQDVVDGFISKIDGTTGSYLRSNVSSNSINGQNDVTTIGNHQTLATTEIITNSNLSTKLHPNPTTGKVTLEIKSDLANNQIEYITIYDVTGRKVQEINTQTSQNSFDINLSSQQTGVYFVEMMINQELITKRIVLMK
ncbi:T9SS type A sorting domain-containing protein [Aureispira sp. CCB-E]|uniref:T9SS type A sorting domain-containing protein n=1 Tax=Aureispira sp. CCB-E TaxID=3051121 RepID=UPI002868F2C7|nr:T9SS type A sorting domain-containing protein [Aureispira sp. CCB-E]WMX12163.1 T9SS type A sorting domain-containing protein [Aureispira sp. CCB-E]